MHGISRFADSTKTGNSPNWKFTKLELHHMASLDLLILQKLETGTSPHGIFEFADSTKTENQQNWNFTTRYLWSCHACGPAY